MGADSEPWRRLPKSSRAKRCLGKTTEMTMMSRRNKVRHDGTEGSWRQLLRRDPTCTARCGQKDVREQLPKEWFIHTHMVDVLTNNLRSFIRIVLSGAAF